MSITFKNRTLLNDETLIAKLVAIDTERELTLDYSYNTDKQVYNFTITDKTGNEILSLFNVSNLENLDKKINELLEYQYKKLATASRELDRRRNEIIFKSGMLSDVFIKEQEYTSDIPIWEILYEIKMIHQIFHIIKTNNIIPQ